MGFDFFDFIQKTNQAVSCDDLVRAVEEQLRPVGVETFLISLLTDHPEYGLPARHGVLRSYPEDWMKHYQRQSYHRIDPVYQRCKSEGAFGWTELMRSGNHSYASRRLMNEAAEAGLKAGVGVGVSVGVGRRIGVGFASSVDMEVTPDKLDFFNHLALHFSKRFLELSANGERAKRLPKLTTMQKEVLKWLATGLSEHQVADAIHISRNTVAYHRKEAYRRLGAVNCPDAVMKALSLGILDNHPFAKFS